MTYVVSVVYRSRYYVTCCCRCSRMNNWEPASLVTACSPLAPSNPAHNHSCPLPHLPQCDAQPHTCNVWLPKFRAESSSELSDALQALGVGSLFDRWRCDLSRLCRNGPLFVTNVVHKVSC